MTRRKGKISEKQILRQWPHHVALPAEAVRGPQNAEAVYGFARTLTSGPRPCHLRRDDRELVVFCFEKPEEAQAFAEPFGGERLAASHQKGK